MEKESGKDCEEDVGKTVQHFPPGNFPRISSKHPRRHSQFALKI